MDSRKAKKKKGKKVLTSARGFAAKLAAEVEDDDSRLRLECGRVRRE